MSIFQTLLLALCVLNLSAIHLVASTNEVIEWPLETLFQKNAQSYKLNDSSSFKINQPFNTTDISYPLVNQGITIIKSTAHSIQGELTGMYALIGQKASQLIIQWAQGSQALPRASPNFNQQILITLKTNDTCLDILFIDYQTVLVDCFNSVSYKNFYYKVVLSQSEIPTIIELNNIIGAKVVNSRINQLLSFKEDNIERKYLFRGVPYDQGDQAFLGDSIIEVFALNAVGDPVQTDHQLDGAVLASVTKTYSTDTTFNLLDFKIDDSGFLIVLDASTKVYKLKFQSSGVWLYHGIIDIPQTKSLAFDIVNYYDLNENTEAIKVTLMFFDYAVQYLWPNNKLNATSKTLIQLGFYQQTTGIFLTTNDYILSQDVEENILYVISSDQSLTLSLVRNTNILANKEYNIITFIEPTQSTTSFLSKGSLILDAEKAVQNGTIEITAFNLDGSDSIAQLTYTILEREDASILVQDNSFTFDMITYPNNATINLSEQFSGPDINYSANLKNSNGTAEVVSNIALNRSSDLPINISFTQILMVNNSDYYQFYEYNSSIYIDICSINENTLFCRNEGQTAQYKFGVMDFERFDAWYENNRVLFSVQTSSNTLVIFVKNETSIYEYYILSLATTQIISYTIQQEDIWIVDSDNQIRVYSWNKTQTILSQNNFVQLGYKGQFKPTQVFSNKALNPHLVIIHNSDSLLVVDFIHDQLTLYAVIQLDQQYGSSELQVGISDSTFWVATNKAGRSSLKEFQFDDLSNVHLQKELDLYDFKFQSRIDSEISQQSGHFTVRALNNINQTVLLVFRPNTFNRDSLYKVIYSGVFIPDNQPFIYSSQVANDLLVYYNDGKYQQSIRYLEKPYVIVRPSLTQSQELTLKYGNFKNSYSLSQGIQVLDTHINITQSTSNLNIIVNTSMNGSQQFYLNDSIYRSQVLSYELVANDTNISIVDHFERIQLKSNYITARGFSSFSNGTLIVQTKNQIWLSVNGSVTSMINLFIPSPRFGCNLVQPKADGTILFSICNDGTDTYAYITSCTRQQQCYPVDYIIIPGVTEVTKFKFIDNFMFILDTQGILSIFSPKLQQDRWTIDNINKLDSEYFQVPTFINDFDLVLYKDSSAGNHSMIKIYVTDSVRGLINIDGLYENSKIVFNQKQCDLGVKQLLINAKQQISYSTQFLSTKIVPGAGSFHSVLLTTDNANHFVFTVEYDVRNASEIVLKSIKLTSILYRLPWKTLNKFTIMNDTLFLAHQDTDFSFNVVAYNLDDSPTIYAQGRFTTILYGEFIKYFCLSHDPLQRSILTNEPIWAHKYNKLAYIQIQNPSSVQSQTVSVKVSSGFDQATSQFNIVNHSTSEEEGWKWWYTLLIILGVILLIGLIGLFVVKKRKQNDNNHYGKFLDHGNVQQNKDNSSIV